MTNTKIWTKESVNKKGEKYFNSVNWINNSLKEGESYKTKLIDKYGKEYDISIKKSRQVKSDYTIWGEFTINGLTKRLYEKEYSWGKSVGGTIDSDNKIYLNIEELPGKVKVKLSQNITDLEDNIENDIIEEVDF